MDKKNIKIIPFQPLTMSSNAHWFMTALADLCLCRSDADFLLLSLATFMRSLTPEVFEEVFGEQADFAKKRNFQLYTEAKNREENIPTHIPNRIKTIKTRVNNEPKWETDSR